MRAALNEKNLVLTFDLLESSLLRHLFQQIIANYQIKPEQLDPKAASAWYSTKGCQAAGMSREETRDWLETLYGYKSASLSHLRNWSGVLESPNQGHCHIQLTLAEASILLTAVNDHRLWLAAKHDIGQKEMDACALPTFNTLEASQQIALSEISFLAGLIERMLRFLPGNPADWMETLELE